MAESQTIAEAIFKDVELEQNYQYLTERPPRLSDTGFLHIGRTAVSPEGLKFVGFGVTGWQVGEDTLHDTWTPITEFYELPEDAQTIGRQGKGVGPRMYNTPYALTATAENPETVGAYEFVIKPEMIDRRHIADSRFNAVTEHIGRVIGSKLDSVSGEVQTVHYAHRQSDAILYPQTPRGTWVQRRRSARKEVGIPERLMVIRNPNITLKKIGEYHRSHA